MDILYFTTEVQQERNLGFNMLNGEVFHCDQCDNPILHHGRTEDESVECFLQSVSNLMLMDISYDMIILEQEFRCRIIQATGIDNTLASSHNFCAFNMISFFKKTLSDSFVKGAL